MKRQIIEKLLARGLKKTASGSKEFWREYRKIYDALPETQAKRDEYQRKYNERRRKKK